MVGEPAKRLARRVMRRPLEKTGMLRLAVAAAGATALVLLLCAASSLRCSAAVDYALAAPRKLWSGGVSIAAVAAPTSERGGATAVPVEVAGEEECDLFDGEWVWDDTYPLYRSADCPFLDPGFRCSENGRPDASYSKWRWQPSRCDLTRGAYFQEGNEVKMEMTVHDAYHRSIQTLFNWLHKEVNTSKTQVIFRTYAPVHFRGGDWRSGGSCHLETLPVTTPFKSLEEWADQLLPVNNIFGSSIKPKLPGLAILNVTQMTAQRKDGHLSVYISPSGPVPLNKQDCSHWCLPGVPDTWNELLYAVFMKRQTMMDQNVSLAGSRTLNTG